MEVSNQTRPQSSKFKRVKVARILESRYEDGVRPESWDLRKPGTDVIVTSEGEKIILSSTGGQSTPQPGWSILLKDQDSVGVCWTLYGMGK